MGHDRCEQGWFTEGDNQLQPVIFGARREEKRYLEVDLASRYESPLDLRDGCELRRLYAVASGCQGSQSTPDRSGKR